MSSALEAPSLFWFAGIEVVVLVGVLSLSLKASSLFSKSWSVVGREWRMSSANGCGCWCNELLVTFRVLSISVVSLMIACSCRPGTRPRARTSLPGPCSRLFLAWPVVQSLHLCSFS